MKSFRRAGTAAVVAAMVSALLFSSACTRKDTDITSTAPASETTAASSVSAETETSDGESSAGESKVDVDESGNEETAAPSESSSVTLPDPVYTRLREEKITDFEESDSYGEIYIFSGDRESGRYGFFDRSGRIVTDPVFASAIPLSSGDYVVTGEDGKAGFISHDGAIYTGLKYDGYCIDRITGQLLFLKKTETGFLCYTFDTESGKQDVERGIEVDFEALGDGANADSLRLDSTFRDYAEFYYASSDRYLLIDGLTGKIVEAPSEKATWMGSFFMYRGDDGIYKFYNAQGEELLQERNYTLVESNGTNILCVGQESIDVYDVNLKHVASMETAGKKVEEIYFIQDRIFLFLEDSIELYNMDLSKVNTTIERKGDGYFYPATYIATQNAGDWSATMPPVMEWHTGGNTQLINMQNGNTIEISGDCRASGVDDCLVVEEAGKKWKLMRASDFEVLAEGAGDVRTYVDRKDGKLYIESFDGEKKETESGALYVISSVIDLYAMKDGALVLENFTDPGCDDVRLMDIRNGYFYFCPEHGDMTATVLLDNAGNVVFRYYPDAE